MDQVNHPKHYQLNGVECIDLMEQELGLVAVIYFCKCNAFKYEFRAGNKPGNSKEQDLKKAEWYRNKQEELEHKLF